MKHEQVKAAMKAEEGRDDDDAQEGPEANHEALSRRGSSTNHEAHQGGDSEDSFELLDTINWCSRRQRYKPGVLCVRTKKVVKKN